MNTKKQVPFLCAPAHYGEVCPRFSRKFRLKKELKSALLSVTAYGVYEAHINRKRVGDFILAPGWTAYQARLQVQTYDVTAMLEKTNLLTLTLGEGWCCGRIGWRTSPPLTLARPLVTASLTLTYKDGTSEEIGVDKRWTVAQSEIRFSGIYDGETYDYTADCEGSEPAELVWRDGGNLIPQIGEAVREVRRLPAVKLILTPKGERVIDFGQEVTGYVECRLKAPRGSEVIYDHFEMLDKEGNVYTESLRSAKQRITVICDGTERIYKPHFTFQGFRYIVLRAFPKTVDVADFTAVVLCSDLRRTGEFSCSSPLVNRLYENVIWGQMGNFVDVPTDCPQRDERLGWTGDAQVFCKTAAYNFDVQRFFTKWLGDLAIEQYADGKVPSVIPDVLRDEGSATSAAWADAATVCPWEIYLAYGDRTILENQFASMQAWVDYMHRAGEQEALRNTDFHYGDWLTMDPTPTNPHLIATAYFAYSTALLIKAGKVLGKDMRAYQSLHKRICRAFRDTFMKDGDLIHPTQTGYALAIHFDLARNKMALGKKLAALVHANGDRLSTGFVGTAYLMQALSETGHVDLAYKLLLCEQFPSWLYSVKQGATTMWEHWDGINEEGEMWDPAMNSFNHYAYGAVASFMYGTMAGIAPTEEAPGYAVFRLAPKVGEGITHVRASYACRQGVICSAWEKVGKKVKYTFDVPQSTTALLTLPGMPETPLAPGHYEYTL